MKRTPPALTLAHFAKPQTIATTHPQWSAITRWYREGMVSMTVVTRETVVVELTDLGREEMANGK